MSENTVGIHEVIKTFKFWPRLFKLFYQTDKKRFLCILFLNLFSGILPVLLIKNTEYLINTVSQNGQDKFKTLTIVFICYGIISFLNNIQDTYTKYFEGIFEKLLTEKITLLIFEKSSVLTLADFENPDIQDQLKRAQSGANYKPFMVFSHVMFIVKSVITLISTCILIFLWKWWAAFLLVFLPFISFTSLLKIGKQEFLLHYKNIPIVREMSYLSYLQVHSASFKEIKLFQLHKYLIEKYKELYLQMFREEKKIMNKRLVATTMFQLLNQSIVLVVILVAILATYQKKILVGSLISYIQTINATNSSSKSIAYSIISLCQNNMYIEQLFLFLDYNSQKVGLESTSINKQNVHEIKSIEFKNVSFKYPGTNKMAVKNINLKVCTGQNIAIVGLNGSGKTTLVKLMCLFYEDYEGEILINGIERSKLNLEIVREKIGTVFQDFIKFDMSIRNNIGFGEIKQLHNNYLIQKAVQKAGIESIVNSAPQFLDTQLGVLFKGGIQLSGGQWQKVSIARAFMRNADLYILDEPSSALDPFSEKEIFEKFNMLVSDKMGVFISHRFTTTKHADKIYVLENGEIIEVGNHDELIESSGVYSELYHTQISNLNDRKSSIYEKVTSN
ncbi:ABC transporter ATP-binding protein [Bacillus paramobilis]|uniref:ABC transporter ATP-binding protein n=1 Tax=Bacillus paramobilis TaxID=2817477 RepID=UPI003D20971F